MAMRTATKELHKRITQAAAHIGRGVRYNNPEMELEGRRLSAVAHIENQILLGRVYITSEDAAHLAKLLFGTAHIDADLDPEDYTTDPVETNAEVLEAIERKRVPVPDADGDIEDEEYDDDVEDL